MGDFDTGTLTQQLKQKVATLMFNSIFTVGALLVGGSAALGGTDTPIEPIDSQTMSIALTTDAFAEGCALYNEVIPLFTMALDGDMSLAMEITDAYIISKLEEGADPSGASRLTVEARDMFLDAVHDCI